MYQVPVSENSDGVTALVIRGRREKLQPPSQAYFETLHEGVRAWFEHLLAVADRKGFSEQVKPFEDDDFYQLWHPMDYETQQKQVWAVRNASGKCRMIYISVYRMPSGRYEVTAYLA